MRVEIFDPQLKQFVEQVSGTGSARQPQFASWRVGWSL